MAFINSYSEFLKYHTDRDHNMINEVFDVMVGDQIAVWNSTKNIQEKFEVTEKMYLPGLLELLPLGKKDHIVINPKDHTIFKLPAHLTTNFGVRCQCGAIHTSFENHHLFYCPLYKRQDR